MAANERVEITGRKLIGPTIPAEAMRHLDWITDDGAHISNVWQPDAITIRGGKLILRQPNAKLKTYQEGTPHKTPIIATYRYKNEEGALVDYNIHEDGSVGELNLRMQDLSSPATINERTHVYRRPHLPNDGRVFEYRLGSAEDGKLILHRRVEEESYPFGKIEEPLTPVPPKLIGETTMGGIGTERLPLSEMSLEKARRVLVDVALTPEKTQFDPSSYAGHEMIEIREALLVTYADLVEKHGLEDVGSFRGLTKDGPGNTSVDLYLHNDSIAAICLRLSNQTTLIDMEFPYQGIMASYSNFQDGINVSYSHYRSERSYGPRQDPPSQQEMAQLMRGLRWLTANMLLWDIPGVILPNDLTNHAMTIATIATKPALPESAESSIQETQQERIRRYFERINAHLLPDEQPAILQALRSVLTDMPTETQALEKYALETGNINPPGEALLYGLANAMESKEGEAVIRRIREEHQDQAPQVLEQTIRQQLIDGVRIMYTRIFGADKK